jgi:hypothetical protein
MPRAVRLALGAILDAKSLFSQFVDAGRVLSGARQDFRQGYPGTAGVDQYAQDRSGLRFALR